MKIEEHIDKYQIIFENKNDIIYFSDKFYKHTNGWDNIDEWIKNLESRKSIILYKRWSFSNEVKMLFREEKLKRIFNDGRNF